MNVSCDLRKMVMINSGNSWTLCLRLSGRTEEERSHLHRIALYLLQQMVRNCECSW